MSNLETDSLSSHDAIAHDNIAFDDDVASILEMQLFYEAKENSK